VKLYNVNKNQIGLLLIFLIWPFGAFLYAISKFHKKEAKNIVYLFLILFGLTFVLGNEKLDSFRYAQYFQDMSKFSFSDFKRIFASFLLSEKTLDLAQPIISFIVSRITNDYHLLFGVIAAIFGYFYLKSTSIVHKQYYENKSRLALLFLLFFALIINPIFNINGYRFWIATWVFFLGAYHLISSKEKKYILLSFLAVFFHFSFVIPNLVLLIYLFLGNRNKLYYIFLIISVFISDIIFQLFPSVISYLDVGIAAKVGRYANVDQMEKIAEHTEWAIEQGKWYLYLPGKLTFYYITFSFLYLNYKYKKFRYTIELKNLFSFSLLLLAFANTVSFIPSMGRFRTIFLLFGLSFIIGLLTTSKIKKNNWLLIVGLIPFSLNLITVIRLGLDLLNPWLFTLLPSPFIFDDISIYQWLFK